MVNNDIDFHDYQVDYNTVNSIYRDLFRDEKQQEYKKVIRIDGK